MAYVLNYLVFFLLYTYLKYPHTNGSLRYYFLLQLPITF